MNTYKHRFWCVCPQDEHCSVEYKLKMAHDEMILVEDIIMELRRITAIPRYQEDIARCLAEVFHECKIKLVGWHSGVKVITEL